MGGAACQGRVLKRLRGHSRKILVRSPNWIGDAVMSTPAMGAIRAAFPSSEIVLAANPAVCELIESPPVLRFGDSL